MKQHKGGRQSSQPKFHLSAARAARRARRKRKISRTTFEGLADPLFPATFFVRNLRALRRELGWNRLSVRNRRHRLLKVLTGRCLFFLEVKKWVERQDGGPFTARAPQDVRDPCNPGSYCTHCGGCCEIASGLPDFPSPTMIPLHWRLIFGNGLGEGHRFCAFLWESAGSGNSLCAIHSFRPDPCRAFEQEECGVLQQDPDYSHFSHPEELRRGYRSLLHLIDGR